MANNVQLIRGQIAIHTARADVPLSEQGFPAQLHGEWFPTGLLPNHAWTGSPVRVEIVNGNVNDIYPASKTFSSADATDAWYNSANGAFCVRIPAQSNAAATLHLFNEANATSAASLNQTTH